MVVVNSFRKSCKNSLHYFAQTLRLFTLFRPPLDGDAALPGLDVHVVLLNGLPRREAIANHCLSPP